MDVTTKRGATPTMVEWAILSWVAGIVNMIQHHNFSLYDLTLNLDYINSIVY